MSMAIFYLLLAVCLDVVANICLKWSKGFSHKVYGLVAIVLILVAFTSLSQAVKYINLSNAYAAWGGLGLIATSLVDWCMFGQKIKKQGWVGILLVTCGVVVLHSV